MSSSYQTQYYPQQPNNNNLGLLTTGALAGGGLATVAFLNDGKLLKDLTGKKYPKSKETPVPVDRFTTQTTTAVGYPVGYSANPGVVQGDLAAMQQGLYKENLLLDPSKQYVVRPTGQQTQKVKRKPFRR